LLMALYDSLDVLIRPLAIDRNGDERGKAICIPRLIETGAERRDARLHEGEKAVEALGRLRASASSALLQHIWKPGRFGAGYIQTN